MKAYIIPFKQDRRVGFGDKEGYKIKGPILYVPNKGAIFYELTIMGDAEVHCLVPAFVDFVDSNKTILAQIEKGIRGERLLGDYQGPNFDLSQGLTEVDVPESEMDRILYDSTISAELRNRFQMASTKLLSDLETRVGHGKLIME